jgi:hypothetical protein
MTMMEVHSVRQRTVCGTLRRAGRDRLTPSASQQRPRTAMARKCGISPRAAPPGTVRIGQTPLG